MRLIDADKLKYYGNHIGDEYEDRFHDAQWAYRSDIDSAPSIDIVHCVECRYKEMEICPMYRLLRAGILKPYNFCSYGERNSE